MKFRSRIVVATLASAAVMLGGQVGIGQATQGHDDHGNKGDKGSQATKVFTLDPSTHGNPEGVAWDKRGDAFFVGATGDGTIYRGTLKDPTATEFIAFPKTDGRSAVGMKVSRGRLYVAGGATGKIFVYDIATKATVATFDTGTGGFLNDLVVTHRGDVYVTDSFRPTLWHVTGDQVKAGSGLPEAISVAPEIEYVAGAFNLNGIVEQRGGKELIVVNSATGKFFRVDVRKHGQATRSIAAIDGLLLKGSDGMIVDRGRLVVVVGTPPALHFVKLSKHSSMGRVDDVRTDASLRGPSTVARAENRYLVVNANFPPAPQVTPFTVSGLSRKGHHQSR